MSLHNSCCTLLIIHRHPYIKITGIIYQGVIYLTDAANKWFTIFEYYLLLLSSTFCVAASASAPLIIILPFTSMQRSLWSHFQTRFQHGSLESNLAHYMVCSLCIILYQHLDICPEFVWFIIFVVKQIYDFLIVYSLLI